MNKNLLNFEVKLYGDLVPYSSTLTKARARIFYKYGNRNGTYLTDEFSEKLIKTLPYTPVKGIYTLEEGDFLDHGKSRTLGRIYGIVPETANIAWEVHVDDDGIERTYACADVLLFTALYKEATEIVGKSLSMELYEKAMVGDWKMVEGREYYVFSEGCFLGLQILGDEIEPCFEGAGFFSLKDTFNELLKDIQNYDLNNKGGQEKMALNFKVANSEKFNALWSLINVNYTEENEWAIDYSILEVYDENFLAKNHETGEYTLIPYSVDENNVYSLGEEKVNHSIYLTNEGENDILNSIKEKNNNTFDGVVENFEKIDELGNKILEFENTISTLTTERDNSIQQYEALKERFEALETEKGELEQYKLDDEKNKKEAIVSKYSAKLSEEVLAPFKNNLSNYSIIDLEKNLAYELVNSDNSLFSNNTETYIPKDETIVSGIDEILDKYNK